MPSDARIGSENVSVFSRVSLIRRRADGGATSSTLRWPESAKLISSKEKSGARGTTRLRAPK